MFSLFPIKHPRLGLCKVATQGKGAGVSEILGAGIFVTYTYLTPTVMSP